MGADGKRIAREIAERHGRPLSDHRAELVDRRAGELFGERNTDPQPLPFVRELLEAVTAGSASRGRSRRPASRTRPSPRSRALDLASPPRIVDASHVTHAKPAPDLLLAGAEQLGVTARDCWYVGDSTWDMIAARSAMMTGVGVPSGATDARVAAVGRCRPGRRRRRASCTGCSRDRGMLPS